jgi:hypothetical protein
MNHGFCKEDELQSSVVEKPNHVFLFGAGASYGSDGSHLYRSGELPPLGSNLFEKLYEDKSLKSWSGLPKNIAETFFSKTFEEAMDYFDSSEDWAKDSFQRDLNLFRYFYKFSSKPSNLYWKLSQIISKRLKVSKWTGAAVSINYDRLLEEALMKNAVFTVVKGVTFYDDRLPPLKTNQLFEVCYPHGACQFFMGQNWFQGEGNIVFGENARLTQDGGVNHILIKENIPKACERKQIPMICRYQSNKRASVKNYFIDLQQKRSSEIFRSAETISILGVYCSYETDKHIWDSLSETLAYIYYLEPSKKSQRVFREWAEKSNKKESTDFTIKDFTFKDGFKFLKKVNDL